MSAAAVAAAAVGVHDEAPQHEPSFVLHECRGEALVVDDNPDITSMLTVVLRLSGYNVSSARNGSDALTTALAKHFDVIISDIGMPGMDGYELARVLRAMPEYRGVPMVAMTGFDMYDDRDRALEAGFNTHLRKPVDLLDLKRAINLTTH